MVLRFTGGSEERRRGPCQLVIVHELVAVVRDLLIRAVLAKTVDRVDEELPTQLRLGQVGCCLGRIRLLESR
jgi:hypothetical protein